MYRIREILNKSKVYSNDNTKLEAESQSYEISLNVDDFNCYSVLSCPAVSDCAS